MQRLLLAVALLTGAVTNAAGYAYTYYNPSATAFTSTSITNDFTKNGTIGCVSGYGYGCLAGTTSGAGSLIAKSSFVPASDYEIKAEMAVKQSASYGGTVVLVRASANASFDPNGTYDSGTYDAVVIASPQLLSDGSCYATLQYWERTSATNIGSKTMYWATPIQCDAFLRVRVVAFGNNVWIMIRNQVYPAGSNLTGGLPGVGTYNVPSGTGFYDVAVGPRSLSKPATVNPQDLSSSVYSNSVSLHWKSPTENSDMDMIGIGERIVVGGSSVPGCSTGGAVFTTETTDFTDPTVCPDTVYNYQVYDVSFHGVTGDPTPWQDLRTLTLGNIDPRRSGVKPLGTYWGGGQEQIDMVSGNLNYTIPLLTAQGRSFTVPISLSYNAQNWRMMQAACGKQGRTSAMASVGS
jgi:hypothetical protein